jgi:aminopeptidase-like protein
MSIRQALTEELSAPGIGHEIYDLASEIYPICRSITGQGVRETLDCLSRHINITTHKVPTGTKVFDWEIPGEWTIRDAFIRNESGERVVDFNSSNLHVLNYSIPVNVRLPLSDLKRHVFTLPEQPDLIPYRTSYYTESWGFCMSHRQLSSLPDGVYEAVIDSSIEPGHLYYGEFLHPGASKDEFLLSAHICHPSLANDNCSGLALLTHLAKRLSSLRTRYSYRFLFAPGTIGSISWLARNEDMVSRIKHGLVVSCVGDGGGPTYKRSRRGDAMIDRAMYHALKHNWPSAKVLDFIPYGYDERQFCSPGFNLPVGLLQRSQFGTFPEYHTSADNLDFIRPEHLAASYRLITDVIGTIEGNHRPVNLLPKCEPQLGRRGLFSSLGGDPDGPAKSMALLWVLNLADGDHTLLDIAERSGMAFQTVADAASLLVDHDLLSYQRDDWQ